MEFLKRITRSIGSRSITVHAMPADEGIRITFRHGNQLLDYQKLVNDPTGKTLPSQVLEYLDNNIGGASGDFRVPYPHAVQLLRTLKRRPTDKLLFDCDAVENLQVILRPAAFAVHWDYDPVRHALIRRLVGADRHLGRCWFQQGNTIWSLDAIPEQVSKWLSATHLSDRYVFRFVAEVMPICTGAGYPVKCNLHLVEAIRFSLRLITTRKSFMQVTLECNYPELKATLSPLEGDDSNVISGLALLPKLRPLLSDRMIELIRAGGATFMGEQIPAFIQDELRPRAEQLSIDIRQIDKVYPIVAADQLKPVWHLEPTTRRSVGGQRAVASIAYNGKTVSLVSLHAIAASQRFYPIDGAWIEFTTSFRTNLDTTIKNGGVSYDLTPAELLGSSSEFLRRIKVVSPSLPQLRIDIANTIREQREQVRKLLTTLRSHGLPLVISGLQVDMPRLLAEMCLELLSKHNEFDVLWIVGKKRKDALQQILLDVAKASSRPLQTARISMLSPDQLNRQIADHEWALVIFQDLDQIVPSTDFARAYQFIRRLWTVATFTNRRWHENPTLRERVLATLRLIPDNLSAFLSICHHTFPDQQESLITRITSPFKRLLVDAPDDIHASPIPARETLHSLSPTPPQIKPLARSPVNLTGIGIASTWDRFLQQALEFADRVEPRCEPIPFMRYYPTYDDMTTEQFRWYLHWRDQFRRGNPISTDLSYLFVHIYEGLNLVGFRSPQDAFDHLVTLWTHYRPLQPKLDRYLVDWLADFVVVHRLPIDPLDWYARVLLMGVSAGDPDLAFTAWAHGRDYATFPVSLLFKLINYTPTKNKFYRDHNQNQAVDAAFIKGIQALDEWLLQTEKRSLFDMDATGAEEVSRPPFAGAVHRFGNTPMRIAQVRRWTHASQFADDLIGILKHIENILRDRAGFGSKLRGIACPQAWKDLLDDVFGVVPSAASPANKRGRPRRSQVGYADIAQLPARREITIDLDALAWLTRETEEIRSRLLADDEFQVTEDQLGDPQSEPLQERSSTALPASYTERPRDAPSGLLTDLPEVAAAMGAADDVGASLLRLLRKSDWQAAPAILETVIEGGFLNLHMDAINNRAFDQFNDALIFFEDGMWIVAEDYRDEISYILDHPAYEMKPLVPTPPPQKLETADAFGELTEEWARFAQLLQPHHWEALASLVARVDVAARLEAIARSVYTTSNLLVDTLNSAAMDTIGDIIIDTLSDPPCVEDEDYEQLGELLTWASTNQVLEL